MMYRINRGVDGGGGRLRVCGALLLALAVMLGVAMSTAPSALAAVEGREVAEPSPRQGNVPGDALGNISDSQWWRDIRQGGQGSVSFPDKKLGVLVQSEGDNWRAVRNGPVSVYGSWLLLGAIILLALFFALRGRLRVESGMSGRTIERFDDLDRFAHWVVAVSFIVLALTGLNMLYGRYVLLPVLGPEVFSAITTAGKYAHNFVAFAFMLGLVLLFVLWVRDNIPNRYDLTWLAKAGGWFGKGVHPPAMKFNAGQKIVFWIVVLGGISISMSGLALLFPYQLPFFEKTFQALNAFGAGLPASLEPRQEMQLNQLWHAVLGLVLIAVIMAHIYIGSVGMEGAFSAMGTGKVDENWAREHHPQWVAELKGRQPASARGKRGGRGGKPQPAE